MIIEEHYNIPCIGVMRTEETPSCATCCLWKSCDIFRGLDAPCYNAYRDKGEFVNYHYVMRCAPERKSFIQKLYQLIKR